MARPMTMAEKILAAHAGLEEVVPGQLIECDLDLVLSNDVTAPIAIKEFKKVGVDKVFDPTKIALVPDHYVPNKDIQSAEQAKMTREFAREQGITHFYEVGCMGVEHALLPEQGVVGAGDLIIGADSHTCTYGALGAFATGVGSTDAAIGYATGKAWFKVPESILFNVEGQLQPGVTGKDIILHIIGMIGVDGALYQAMEFRGSAIESLTMDERLSISNMAIEAGGKAGLIAVDEVTRAYMDGRTERPYKEYHSDPDAVYAKVYNINAADIVPTVAFPHLPENKPTYLMGVGTPANILEAVDRGVDFFDCVYPSRNGRHGHVYTNHGKMNLFNQKYELDPRPIEEGCQCPACRHYSRAYIRHLLKAKEMLGMRLCVLNNLDFYNNMMTEIRTALDEGNFASYKRAKLAGFEEYDKKE